jgi:hypothetical protein
MVSDSRPFFRFRAALVEHPLGDHRAALRIVVKLHGVTSQQG